MAPAAAYDDITDWHEQEFLPGTAAAGADALGIGAALDDLLGRGRGICLGIGCGTGIHASRRDPPGLPGRALDQGILDHPGCGDKVGATHLPLPALIHAFLNAGLAPEQLAEGGRPTPVMLAIRARKQP